MRSSSLVALAAAAAAAAFDVSLSAQPAAPAQSGPEATETLQEVQSLQAVCGAQCHSLQIVMDTPRSYQAWQDTVQDMVDRGAQGTDDQYADILDFLHRTMTTINVNSADEAELETVLGISPQVAHSIVARRRSQPFVSLADLQSLAGMSKAALEGKSHLIYFH